MNTNTPARKTPRRSLIEVMEVLNEATHQIEAVLDLINLAKNPVGVSHITHLFEPVRRSLSDAHADLADMNLRSRAQ